MKEDSRKVRRTEAARRAVIDAARLHVKAHKGDPSIVALEAAVERLDFLRQEGEAPREVPGTRQMRVMSLQATVDCPRCGGVGVTLWDSFLSGVANLVGVWFGRYRDAKCSQCSGEGVVCETVAFDEPPALVE